MRPKSVQNRSSDSNGGTTGSGMRLFVLLREEFITFLLIEDILPGVIEVVLSQGSPSSLSQSTSNDQETNR
jgi:hypothetical protein